MEAPVNYSSFERERLTLAEPTDLRIRRNAMELERMIAALTGPELLTLAMFCAVGLVVTVGLCFLVPGFSAVAMFPPTQP
jgi:hypothetical protein